MGRQPNSVIITMSRFWHHRLCAPSAVLASRALGVVYSLASMVLVMGSRSAGSTLLTISVTPELIVEIVSECISSIIACISANSNLSMPEHEVDSVQVQATD